MSLSKEITNLSQIGVYCKFRLISEWTKWGDLLYVRMLIDCVIFKICINHYVLYIIITLPARGMEASAACRLPASRPAPPAQPKHNIAIADFPEKKVADFPGRKIANLA